MPPAPPGVDEPGHRPDPRDPGRPITVRLDDWLVGDLGHPRVDARLLDAVLLRDGRVGRWLQDRGVSINDLEESFPDTGW
jgi:hypothetical protein